MNCYKHVDWSLLCFDGCGLVVMEVVVIETNAYVKSMTKCALMVTDNVMKLGSICNWLKSFLICCYMQSVAIFRSMMRRLKWCFNVCHDKVVDVIDIYAILRFAMRRLKSWSVCCTRTVRCRCPVGWRTHTARSTFCCSRTYPGNTLIASRLCLTSRTSLR